MCPGLRLLALSWGLSERGFGRLVPRLRSERGRVDWGVEAAVAAEMRRWVMEAAADAVATAAAVSRVAWRSWCVAATTAACCCGS